MYVKLLQRKRTGKNVNNQINNLISMIIFCHQNNWWLNGKSENKKVKQCEQKGQTHVLHRCVTLNALKMRYASLMFGAMTVKSI